MKTSINNLFLLPALICGLGMMPDSRVTAQTFTALHHFDAGTYINSDGTAPSAELVLSGNTLYGTATAGGNSGNGTVFKVNTDGSGWTTLHHFTAGACPVDGLVLSGETLYGTAVEGGNAGYGAVFKVDTDGTDFTTLHSFSAAPGPLYTNSDGVRPFGGVILSGNTLYGTAAGGGSSGVGTIFKVNTDGTGFTTLYSFTEQSGPSYTNSDGANPYAGLVLSDGVLYGTCVGGGSSNSGTVFSVGTDGTGFMTLHHFSGVSDGANPWDGLILSGNRLYGTVRNGANGWGTVFAVSTDGLEFVTLHRFSGVSDGAGPRGPLILSNNTLYGTTERGGSAFTGTVFKVNTNGMDFTTLHGFPATSLSEPYPNTDGAEPLGGLVLSGNTLYGTASRGGNAGNGTIFSLSLPPPSFAAWVAGFGLSGAAAAAGADPDGDGLPNAAEFILGGDPLKPAVSGRPGASLSGGNMVFTFLRDDASETPDVILTVVSGIDLVNWPSVFTIGANTTASSPGVTLAENGTAPDTITVTIPQGTDKAYARLKVTIAP